MKNKGFTMIELLAIITILATILLISFPTLINMTRRDKERQYNDMVNTLCKAGETYIYDNQDEYPELGTTGNIMYVDIDDLKNDDLIDKYEKNPKTEKSISGNIKYTVESDKSLKCYYAENMPISNMLMESPKKDDYTADNITFLNTQINNSNISKFLLHNTINISEGYEQKDCSYLQDESVICYWKEDFEEDNVKYYEMNIAANGQIYTPYNSKYLFANLGRYKLTELDLNLINTKYTINMSNMFDATGYDLMTTLNLGKQFNTSNVTNMSNMFWATGSTSMTSLNLGDKFDTSNVTNMEGMFSHTGNDSMVTLNLGDKFDTSNVTKMNGMFDATGYESMISLDLGDKFDTSNVTDMSAMFYETGSTSMTSLNLGSKFDTSNVTKMSVMFYGTGYKSMTSLDLGNKFDTSNVTIMNGMFWATGYKSMTSLDLGNKFMILEDTFTSDMFYECGKSGVLMQVIVPNQSLKDKILSLTNANVPEFWKANDGAIIQIAGS